MTDLTRHLRAAWLFLRHMPYQASLDHEDEWTRTDAGLLDHFLKTGTGQKLERKLQRAAYQSAVNATHATHDTKYRCGWAAGVAALLSVVQTHRLSPAGAQSGDIEEADSAADPFAHLRA